MTKNLTSKQEAFAQAVASGKSQADSYRIAYDAANMKPETIQSKASILMKKGMVRARVDELQKQISEKCLWSREDSVLALREIAGDTEARANEKVAAIKELNAMHGFNAPVKLDVAGAISLIEVVVVDPK